MTATPNDSSDTTAPVQEPSGPPAEESTPTPTTDTAATSPEATQTEAEPAAGASEPDDPAQAAPAAQGTPAADAPDEPGQEIAPDAAVGEPQAAPEAGAAEPVTAEPAAETESATDPEAGAATADVTDEAEADTDDVDHEDEDDDGALAGGVEQNPEAIAAETASEPAPAEAAPAKKKAKKKKAAGPDPAAIVRRIGKTSEEALAYVADPDPKLSRMARKHREAVISEIPPVTAGALLGPDALCRHFLASAASGRYVDLFHLWELFKAFPDDCKPVLASRQRAQEKARKKLQTATHLGLLGSADRVAADIDRATGLPWRWLKDILEPMGPAIRQRPAVLAAMLRRDPSYAVDIPSEPSDRWLAEAAALRESGNEVPDAIDALLGQYADRLPATLSTLAMAQQQYPDRVPALIDRVDLSAPDIGAIMAWARDHGHGDQLVAKINDDVVTAASSSRAEGLARWQTWRDRGVDVELPESLAAPTLEGLDLGRPESAELIKMLIDGGADLDAQAILDGVAAENRMLGEKAYEAFVCAGFNDVHLPLALEGNPMVRADTRCPACQAWTWVRPGLEKRCPRTECPLRAAADPDRAAAEAEATVDAAVATLAATPAATPAPAPTPSERPQPAPTAPRPSAPPSAPDPVAESSAPAADAPAPPADTPEPAANPPAQAADGEQPTGEQPTGEQPTGEQPTGDRA